MRHILVVDDQAHVRAAILVALRSNGFSGVGVEDGISALRTFPTGGFDLVIVDLYLPGLDGVRTIKALREMSANLPVIAISGVLLRDSQHTALDFFSGLPELANVICLQKPFRSPELLRSIQAALGVTV